MEKSFNDQELSDIMKEIEALEDECKTEEDFKAESHEVIEDLAHLDEEAAIPLAKKTESNVIGFDSKSQYSTSGVTTSPAIMSFKVQGDLNLELQFEIGGKVIKLDVSESGMNIKMEGGITFSVPVSGAAPLKKAI